MRGCAGGADVNATIQYKDDTEIEKAMWLLRSTSKG